jgi:hypothetical protein
MTEATKAKTEDTDQSGSRKESQAQSQQMRLDEELAESFPASDPPSITQPGIKLGAPERQTPPARFDAASS